MKNQGLLQTGGLQQAFFAPFSGRQPLRSGRSGSRSFIILTFWEKGDL